MSIEQILAALTTAIEANTAAILASSGKKEAAEAAPAPETKAAPARTRKAAAPAAAKEEPAAPKYTAEQVKAAAVKVKDELGTKTAKQLIADHGAAELAKLKPENYEAFVLAAEALLAGDGEDGSDEDDGL